MAMTTSSRWRPSALPSRSSLSPYESDVSKKVMPASRAASTTGGTSSSCIPMPKLLVPRPTTETSSDPIRRFSMVSVLPFPSLGDERHAAGRVGPMRPATLLLQTEGECDIDPERLLDVFGEQRQRFVTIVRGFGPEDWVARTRCTDWSAHDVVRHLCDANVLILRGSADDSTLDVAAGFDPRVTPGEWLRASAGESPDASLERFAATTEDLLALARSRLAERRSSTCTYRTGRWTGPSSCSMPSGIPGCTSATC